jgi:hypothetical protein
MTDLQRILHKKKHIVIASYLGIKKEEEFINAITEATELVIKESDRINGNPGNEILLLVDVTDAVINANVVAAFKTSAQMAKPYVKKMAVVGIMGIRKFLLETVNRFSGMGGRPFLDIEKAKDWLVE